MRSPLRSNRPSACSTCSAASACLPGEAQDFGEVEKHGAAVAQSASVRPAILRPRPRGSRLRLEAPLAGEELGSDPSPGVLSADVVRPAASFCARSSQLGRLVVPALRVEGIGELGGNRRKARLVVHPFERRRSTPQGAARPPPGRPRASRSRPSMRPLLFAERVDVPDLLVGRRSLRDMEPRFVESAVDRLEPSHEARGRSRDPPRSVASSRSSSQRSSASATGVGP